MPSIRIREFAILMLLCAPLEAQVLTPANGGTGATTASGAVSNLLSNPSSGYYVIDCTSGTACGPSAYSVSLTINPGSVTCTPASACTIPRHGSVKNENSNYPVVAADFTNDALIYSTSNSSITYTLVASGSQPAAGLCIWAHNQGLGAVTIARNGQDINGGTASLKLYPATAGGPTAAEICSDGTNYRADVFGNVAAPEVVISAGDVPTFADTTGRVLADSPLNLSNTDLTMGYFEADITAGTQLIVSSAGTGTVLVDNNGTAAGLYLTYDSGPAALWYYSPTFAEYVWDISNGESPGGSLYGGFVGDGTNLTTLPGNYAAGFGAGSAETALTAGQVNLTNSTDNACLPIVLGYTSYGYADLTAINGFCENSYTNVMQLQTAQFASPVATSSLPSCASGLLGERREVTDATSATPGTTLAGGGNYKIAVQCIENTSGPTYTWIID